MCTKKHADKEYDVPQERKKMDFDDRFAGITPTRGDESFSSHYVLSRNTLATEHCCLPKDLTYRGERVPIAQGMS